MRLHASFRSTTSLAAGRNDARLTVSILTDALDEADETFELSVSAGDLTGTPATATITIQDDDGASLTPTVGAHPDCDAHAGDAA